MSNDLFDLSGKTAVVTGGTGVLGKAMSMALARNGAKVVLLGRSLERAEVAVAELNTLGYEAMGVSADVLNKEQLIQAGEHITSVWGTPDILVNGAGGNDPGATTSPDKEFFDLPEEALRHVMDLNLMGSILPSQVFGKAMSEKDSATIINVSSMNSFRPLTRIVGYSAAKAAINNFTQWLAVHLAQEYGSGLRVNAIAPGFFETAQNKFLLRQDDGALTVRGQQIIGHTPLGRFGAPEDIDGTLLWLASDASTFVTGIVVPVDGGFSAFSGV